MWSFAPPATIVGISRDVSERYALEAERKTALEQHELLASHTADIISLHAPSERFEFLYVSPSVSVMLGYRAAALLGTSIYELVHKDDLIAWRMVTCGVARGLSVPKTAANVD